MAKKRKAIAIDKRETAQRKLKKKKKSTVKEYKKNLRFVYFDSSRMIEKSILFEIVNKNKQIAKYD